MLKDLVIGDMHFGVKSNNVTWLDQQVRFFNEQIFPLVESHDRVIILGDLFDVRYSVQQQVGYEVKNLIRRLSSMNKPVYIIAGNHDYYSPIIDFEKCNAYEVVFGEEFEMVHDNVHFITSAPLLTDRTLMLPWYCTEDEERYVQVTKEYRGQYDVIYCHTDLEHWPENKIALKGDAVVYSGHIHYPWTNPQAGLYNIGAACAFTFNDVNAERYVYTICGKDITERHKNVTTPLFKRFYNERVFTLQKEDTINSYVHLYISKENIAKASYIERIAEIKKTFPYLLMRVVQTDELFDSLTIGGADLSTNIHEYIHKNMPQHLQPKLEIIDNKLKEH